MISIFELVHDCAGASLGRPDRGVATRSDQQNVCGGSPTAVLWITQVEF